MFLVLLAIAFAIGGALFSIRLGDKTAKLIGVAALGVMIVAMLPEVAAHEFVQLAVAIVAGSLGLIAFDRSRKLRLAALTREAIRRRQAEVADDTEEAS